MLVPLLGLASCAAPDATDDEARLTCPASLDILPTGSEHVCAQIDGTDEALSCCVEAEGLGLESLDESYVDDVLEPKLHAQGIAVDDVVSPLSALCISDTLGLYAGLEGRGAQLSIRGESPAIWQVKSWQTSTCDPASDDVGTLAGCAVLLDALTGAYLSEAFVYASISCSEGDR